MAESAPRKQSLGKFIFIRVHLPPLLYKREGFLKKEKRTRVYLISAFRRMDLFGIDEQKGWFFQKVDAMKNKGCLKPIRAFLDSVQNLKNQKTTNFLLKEK